LTDSNTDVSEQAQPVPEESQAKTAPASPETPKVPLTKEKQSNSFLGIILIFAVFLLTGAAAAVLYLTTKDSKKNTIPANYIPEEKTSSAMSTPGITTTTSSSQGEDSYEGWETYTNDLVGYSLKYPGNYTITENPTLGKNCVEVSKGTVRIIIGYDDVMFCFRTGVGAYDIEKTEKTYSINGTTFTVEEWYEKTDQPDGTFGNIYAQLELEQSPEFGLEYWGNPKETFEENRTTVTQIIESITWEE